LWCRQALANALAAAPSMWTLGNAGMGALQVLQFSLKKKLSLFLMALIFTYHSPRRDWQKIKTQPLPMQHPKLSMS
jgi:hypothetical protein